MTRPGLTDDLDHLGPTVDVPTAARLLGCGRTLAYDLVRRGEFPCRVLRLGRRHVIPTAELLKALGLHVDAVADHRPANERG